MISFILLLLSMVKIIIKKTKTQTLKFQIAQITVACDLKLTDVQMWFYPRKMTKCCQSISNFAADSCQKKSILMKC